jgi:hypothetical protein
VRALDAAHATPAAAAGALLAATALVSERWGERSEPPKRACGGASEASPRSERSERIGPSAGNRADPARVSGRARGNERAPLGIGPSAGKRAGPARVLGQARENERAPLGIGPSAGKRERPARVSGRARR